MRSGNSRCKIAKPDTANHWRALASYLRWKEEDAFRDYGVTAAIVLPLLCCAAVHFTHMAMAAAPVKESDADARVSLTKHEKQWTADRCGSAVNPALLWLVSVWGPSERARSPFG